MGVDGSLNIAAWAVVDGSCVNRMAWPSKGSTFFLGTVAPLTTQPNWLPSMLHFKHCMSRAAYMFHTCMYLATPISFCAFCVVRQLPSVPILHVLFRTFVGYISPLGSLTLMLHAHTIHLQTFCAMLPLFLSIRVPWPHWIRHTFCMHEAPPLGTHGRTLPSSASQLGRPLPLRGLCHLSPCSPPLTGHLHGKPSTAAPR